VSGLKLFGLIIIGSIVLIALVVLAGFLYEVLGL
jgi:hypothetical protein